ncbi:MAG: hypothetical protein AAGE84_19600 [Cyanobacteria bacterium P01_G01_bin.39]
MIAKIIKNTATGSLIGSNDKKSSIVMMVLESNNLIYLNHLKEFKLKIAIALLSKNPETVLQNTVIDPNL